MLEYVNEMESLMSSTTQCGSSGGVSTREIVSRKGVQNKAVALFISSPMLRSPDPPPETGFRTHRAQR
jgi:hypothetical protein